MVLTKNSLQMLDNLIMSDQVVESIIQIFISLLIFCIPIPSLIEEGVLNLSMIIGLLASLGDFCFHILWSSVVKCSCTNDYYVLLIYWPFYLQNGLLYLWKYFSLSLLSLIYVSTNSILLSVCIRFNFLLYALYLKCKSYKQYTVGVCFLSVLSSVCLWVEAFDPYVFGVKY